MDEVKPRNRDNCSDLENDIRCPVQVEGKEPDRRWRGQSVGADAVKRGCALRQVRQGMDQAAAQLVQNVQAPTLHFCGVQE